MPNFYGEPPKDMTDMMRRLVRTVVHECELGNGPPELQDFYDEELKKFKDKLIDFVIDKMGSYERKG